MVAIVDLLMFLSSLLWHEGMFDSWLLPHNITVLYASACPHCSWFSLCWWLNKKKNGEKKAKKSGILSCHHLSCHHISSSHHSWVPKQCCQTLRRLWLCSNTNLTDFSPMLLPSHNAPLLKPNITAPAYLTPQWTFPYRQEPRHNPPILHHQFHWNTGPRFPLSAVTLQPPNPVF